MGKNLHRHADRRSGYRQRANALDECSRRPDENYIIRMEWSGPGEIILQQLNRRQNESRVMLANTATGEAKTIYSETDEAGYPRSTNGGRK